jgi:hypothetical protein
MTLRAEQPPRRRSGRNPTTVLSTEMSNAALLKKAAHASLSSS